MKETTQKYAQSYMQSAYEDFIFISDLKANEILKRATQNTSSIGRINNLIDECIRGTTDFIVIKCLLFVMQYQSAHSHPPVVYYWI